MGVELSVEKKRVIYCLLCGVGGGLIGSFAGKLNTASGALLFTLGVLILTFSIIRIFGGKS